MDMRLDSLGLLWVHTQGQMQIFDGKNFLPVDHQIKEPGFIGKFNKHLNNHFFFLTRAALYKYDASKLDRQTPDVLYFDHFKNQNTRTDFLHEDEDYLYIGHSNDSLLQVRKSDMTIVRDQRLPVPFLLSPSFPTIYTQSSTSAVIDFVGKDYVLYSFDPEKQDLDTLYSLGHSSSCIKTGIDTFVSLGNQYLSVLTHDKVYKVSLPDSIHRFFGKYLLEIHNQQLLVALGLTIYVFDLRKMAWISRFQKTGIGNFFDIKAREMKCDQAGNIYISSFTSGLTKLYPRNPGFHYVGEGFNKKHFVKAITGSDKANLVLLSTLQDGVLIYDTAGRFLHQIIDFPGGFRHQYITGIVKIHDTRYNILTDERVYQLLIDEKGYHVDLLTSIDSEWLNYYSTVVPQISKDKIFVTGWFGLTTISIHPSESLSYELGHPLAARTVATTFRNGYMASGRDTLILMDSLMSHVIRLFPWPGYGLHRCILSKDQNQVLLGTDTGLFNVSVGADHLTTDTIYDKMVYAIQPGNVPGQYWFSTDYGLFRLDEGNQLTNYSIETGVQENEFNSNASYRSEHGKLYFGGINGVTSFYPSKVAREADSIKSFIRTLSVNQNVYARYIPGSAQEGSLVLSHTESNISIELFGQGRKSPGSYNYQYMIPELLEKWVDLGHDGRINFQLATGKYTFFYHVGNSFDPHAPTTNAVTWIIRPPVYSRWWFIVLVGLGFAYIIYYLQGMNRKRRELRLKYNYELSQNIQKERLRISRELHDNIGAQMATVKRNLNFMLEHRDRLTEEQKLQKIQHLEEISTQVNQELRDTIWVTQNAMISVGDFISRIKAYIFQVLGPESPIRVTYDEQCESTFSLGPFIALNIHRICQEAINNIVKHAEATEMKFSFHCTSDQLIVNISDNGKGFNAAADHEGYGLNNMRKRAEQIGAQLHFNRLSDTGSHLEIILPLRASKEIEQHE